MLQSHLCDFSGVYIVIGKTTVHRRRDTNRNIDGYKRKIVLKNCTPFTRPGSKFNKSLIGNAEDLDIIISIHNIMEHKMNYSKILESLVIL